MIEHRICDYSELVVESRTPTLSIYCSLARQLSLCLTAESRPIAQESYTALTAWILPMWLNWHLVVSAGWKMGYAPLFEVTHYC